ncbi:MAG: type III pantothenate kinase [Opitutales bacterium]
MGNLTTAATVLCVDIGNSSTHCGIWSAETARELENLPLTAPASALLELAARAGVDGIAWCSVVPALADALRTAFETAPVPVVEVDYRCAPGLPVTYANPSEIGPDRLANAIGAQALHGLPALIVDLGTATTVSVVRRDDGYVGGMIGPGLRLMTDYLHERTARLPRLDAQSVVTFEPRAGQPGGTTTEAMLLGCHHGYRGLVLALLTEARSMIPPGEGQPSVIITGGASEMLRGLPDGDTWHFHPRLTFHGLGHAWTRFCTTSP